MSLLPIIGWDVIGWENLTPQGIRFGIATILALLAVGPPGDVSPRALCRSNLHPGCGPHGDASGLAGPLTLPAVKRVPVGDRIGPPNERRAGGRLREKNLNPRWITSFRIVRIVA